MKVGSMGQGAVMVKKGNLRAHWRVGFVDDPPCLRDRPRCPGYPGAVERPRETAEVDRVVRGWFVQSGRDYR